VPRTGGEITIRTRNLSLTDKASIINATLGTNHAGAIDIAVSQSLIINGEFSPIFPNGIYNQAAQNATGNTGNIRIAANTVSLINGTKIDSAALRQGNTGNIEIVATESFSADGEGSLPTSTSGVYNSTVDGNTGRIDIRTPSFNLTNGAVIKSESTGQGNTSNINIAATENFTADGAGSLGLGSGIYTQTVDGNAGAIGVQTRSLNLTNGGIISSTAGGQGKTSKIDIVATENFTASGEAPLLLGSGIYSFVTDGIGEDINIQTRSLNLIDGAQINSLVIDRGVSSNIQITATENFTANRTTRLGLPSGVFSNTNTGSGGNLNVRAGSLNLSNGATLSTRTNGAGNAGAIDVSVAQTLTADGENRLVGLPSEIASRSGSTGSTGAIRVRANALNLTNGARINSTSLGQGSASNIEIAIAGSFTADGTTSLNQLAGVSSFTGNGEAADIDLQANSVKLTNGANLSSLASNFSTSPSFDNSSPQVQASSGNISIRATQSFEADGASPLGIPSGVSTNLLRGVAGRAGDITISTNALRFTHGAKLDSSTVGRGDAGQIAITATDSVVFDGRNPVFDSTNSTGNIGSGIASVVAPGAIGNGGDVSITTGSLAITNGAGLATITSGRGNGGSIDINATDSVLVQGESVITTSSLPSAIGDSGDINISAQTVTLRNTSGDRGFVSTFAGGQGEAGDIDIRARSLSLDRFTIETLSFFGSGGNINLGIDRLLLMRNASLISATAGALNAGGDGGNIDIDAQFIVGFRTENSDITANAFSGRGGNIQITTQGLFGLKFRPALTPLTVPSPPVPRSALTVR